VGDDVIDLPAGLSVVVQLQRLDRRRDPHLLRLDRANGTPPLCRTARTRSTASPSTRPATKAAAQT
jgi:hypothetical protein